MTSASVEHSHEIGPTRLPGVPESIQRSLAGFGDAVRFTGRALYNMPTALRQYPSEVFSQAGVLVRGSSLVVLFMQFNLGLLTGLLADVQFGALGVTSLNGAAISIADFRGLSQVILGWVVAAKIGCGFAAELGAMRISDEVDALEVMGIDSMTYLVSTRILAVIFTLPFLILVGYWMTFWGSWIVDSPFLNSTSTGAFWENLWLIQNVRDVFIVVPWGVLTVGLVALISCYYGYRASGGPVGAGQNTSKSMLVAMPMVTLLAAVIIQLTYGIDANAPIAN